jgi:formate-dependent nitrite reductase membrane component NrfD
MDTDLVLTIGVVIAVLSLPSLLSAWVEGRAPRVGSIMVIAAISMIITAVSVRPGGYSFEEIPGVVLRVFARGIG